MTADDTAAALEANLSQGLTAEQVQARREQFGPNELREAPRRSFWQMLLDQFNQFLVIILIVAAIVSALIGWAEFNDSGDTTEFIDAIAIMAIVILNAIMG
ncbi:MAG: cation-transporting P-type ATPase, partial [Anaerolineae bacterium]